MKKFFFFLSSNYKGDIIIKIKDNITKSKNKNMNIFYRLRDIISLLYKTLHYPVSVY